MPQLILEYTSNILEKQDLNGLFKTLHETLAQKLPTDIDSCKSRAIEQDKFYIGNGNSNNAFVNLHIKVMDGRSMEKLSEVGNWVMEILKTHFSESLKERNLQITLQLQELPRKIYFKYVSGE